MYIVGEVLVSEDIFEHHFHCNLNACKGACCVAGDFGAPLDKAEIDTLEKIYPIVKPYLDPEGVRAIEEKGTHTMYEDDDHDFPGTMLREDGACAFLTTAENGIAYCGIESAYRDGKVTFKKPISCELYPIRYSEIPEKGFAALNYDKWDICNPACSQGEDMGIKLYEFLKEAIIRKFDEPFYEEMERAAAHFWEEKSDRKK